jgi:uncharacterized protein YrrD
MEHRLSDLQGHALHATDGEIGHVGDVLVDDRSWNVRYVVVDTGGWLTGRQVLIDPSSVRGIDGGEGRVEVALTRKQIEESPPIESDAPVSQRVQVDLHSYYGWPAYWGAAGAFGSAATPLDVPPEAVPDVPPEAEGDPHLRSGREITGYGVRATDDEIGHVDDLILDDDGWSVRRAVIATRNWLPGRKVVVPVEAIEDVSWSERQVRVSLSRDEVEAAQPAP